MVKWHFLEGVGSQFTGPMVFQWHNFGGLGHVGPVNRWNMMESPAVHIETAGILLGFMNVECSSCLVQDLIGKRKARAGAAPCVASSKTATKPQS